MFPHDATLEFEYESPTRATTVAEAVAREVGEIDEDRSRTTIDRDTETVTVSVVARDLTALRAALNTWFSLVDVAERATAVGERYRSLETNEADETDRSGGDDSHDSHDGDG
ncbi:KEOPS complex subunit Pcc1 [Natronosalvus rutilus]|uniref:KEOPS complex Pcc1-like subunit n=1 Tax=Natronosalvus rutilus TaxID=2953753 RepID=A0A9E7N7J3_9EURY|nr:KEOPS complex subunit Pcc1 [Natronosalvus rutilus]UTF53159.1 KEOPS complex Pcc1-like subunit [Natronosalvus rutilus]